MRNGFLSALAVLGLAAVFLANPAKADADMPSEDVRDMLITGTLLRFNEANQTRNYSVFLARASKEFRTVYSEAEMAKISATFQDRRFRLDEVAI